MDGLDNLKQEAKELGEDACKSRVLEAIGKSAQHGKDWLTLVYELWQEDVIPESVYLRYVKEDGHAKTTGSG